MTDLRATERLLDLIGEQLLLIAERASAGDPSLENVNAIREALTELQRRGDTLVRSEDLRLALGAASHGREYGPAADYAKFDAAIERLENAIGGR